MKTQSKLKIVKQGEYNYIYLYWKGEGKILRVNTGNKYVPSYMTKELYYNSKFPDYFNLNTKTDELKLKFDTYLLKRAVAPELISQGDLKKFLLTGDFEPKKFKVFKPFIAKPKVKNLLDYYFDFLKQKSAQLNYAPSMKDYYSFQNALQDFESYYNLTLTFEYINEPKNDFPTTLRNFLAMDRTEQKTTTTGNLNNNTINKRFQSFKTFLNWVEHQNIFFFYPAIKKYRVEKYDNDIIILEKSEIEMLSKLELPIKFKQKILDLFVLNCYLGLRHSDLSKISKQNFVFEDGDLYYTGLNQKTEISVKIYIQPIAKRILEKYDFVLPSYANQYFNRELKTILKEKELFTNEVTKVRKSLKNVDVKTFKRNELISCHTCRRTFATLCWDAGLPAPEIMSMTGHLKVDTLMKYSRKKSKKFSF